jgi:acetyl-CoA acetyltransferase
VPHAYLVDGVRTPIGRDGGALASVRPDDLAAHALRSLVQRLPGVDWAALDDVLLGCANQAGEDNRNVARMAAQRIRSGDADLVVAGGVESMSRAPFVMPKAEAAFSRANELHDTTIGWRFVNPRMNQMHGTDTMPGTAQNVADEYGVSREDQDAFALRSQERTAKAQTSASM